MVRVNGIREVSWHVRRGQRAVGKGKRSNSSPRLLLTLLLAAILTPAFSLAFPAHSGLKTASAQSAADWAPPRTVYIPETGHTIDGYFLDLWREAGGFYSFGNPITPEMAMPGGHIVQYYQYARFEYWPEGDEFGNTVIVGNIGDELRPVTVRRFTPTGSIDAKDNRATTNTSASATAELLALTRAWLPLPADTGAETRTNWRYIPETGHSVSNGFKDFWERTGEAYYLGNPLTEEYTLGGIVYQVFEKGQLAWEAGGDPYMVPLGKKLAERYKLDMEPIDQGNIPTYSEDLWIPPAPPEPVIDPNAPKLIDIDLTNQYMRVYQGGEVIIETYISSGRVPEFTTPTGTFYVMSKVESQTMEGVLGGEYYNVPDVPDVLYFTGGGHAIHGTYWHNNFGAPMSHGCINVPMDVADFVYNWATVGTQIDIHY